MLTNRGWHRKKLCIKESGYTSWTIASDICDEWVLAGIDESLESSP